jgi:lipopolysaccharide transport system ATP-binding protein
MSPERICHKREHARLISLHHQARMPTAIHVENLSKAYRIGLKEELPNTFVGAVACALTAPLRKWGRLRGLTAAGRDWARAAQAGLPRAEADDVIWALRDVSFDIRPGEVVGVIGQNGAGKSTLLKILSRITEPLRGRAVITGRVSSLLEVGTGFHPELTGRENVYMNGTILGMTKREIDRKFDEIVDFSEVASFLDTPIKRYSSGMNLRLAFAVAAHLDPEILIVDEVLAVGDQQFQNKCLGKLNDVAHSGRTVLFVSHNLAALQRLCQRGIVLRRGKLIADARIAEAVRVYLSGFENQATAELDHRQDRSGQGRVRLKRVEIINRYGDCGPLIMGDPARFVFSLAGAAPAVTCTFTVHDEHGTSLLKCSSGLRSPHDRRGACDRTTFECHIDELLLAPGRYRLDVALRSPAGLEDQIEGAATFELLSGIVRGREPPKSRSDWKLLAPHRWLLPTGP